MPDPFQPKHSVPWATIVVLLVVVYPLSLGPVVWLARTCDFGVLRYSQLRHFTGQSGG